MEGGENMIEIVFASNVSSAPPTYCTGCGCRLEPPPYTETLSNSEKYDDPLP